MLHLSVGVGGGVLLGRRGDGQNYPQIRNRTLDYPGVALGVCNAHVLLPRLLFFRCELR